MAAPQRNKELPKPINFDQLYPGRFMKSGELLGQKRTFTIKSVAIDEVEGEKGKKVQGFLEFKEVDRHFLLNKTNGTCLKGMFGKELSAWEGKRITIYPDSVQFGPDMVDGMRVWGSPDIERDKTVIINLPRRKPITMTMHKVVLDQQPARTNAPVAPTIADYDGCQTREAFAALEQRRGDAWKRMPADQKKALKDASDRAGQRLANTNAQPAERTPFTTATAIEALKACTTNDQRAAVWNDINADFEKAGQDVPLELDDANAQVKEKLASGQLF